MHIAWLGKKSPFCGNVTYGREITNSLLDRGYRVSFLHFAQEEDSQNWPDCQEVILPFLYKSQVYTIPSPKSSKVLSQSLRKLKPDIVHASLTLSPLDFLLPEICEELNIPLVCTFHPAFDNKLRNLQSSTQFLTYQLYAPFLANYDQVIVFSYMQKDLLLRLGVPKERIAVIPNGVDTEKYSPGYSSLELKKQLKAEQIYLYMGRIAPEKNLETLLKAWKISQMGSNNKLLIVGNGILTSSLQPNYGEDDGIFWLGFIGDESRRIEILRGSDVFILPSLVEGLSLSLLEAMSCGMACMATNAGADGEVIKEAGVVLGTQKVFSQLKTLLPVLRDNPDLIDTLKKKSRQRVLERYTLSDNIQQLEELYRRILKNNFNF